MDQREREASQRYRATGKDIVYKTISLTLDEDLMKALKTEVSKTEDRNYSQFIENAVKGAKKIEVPKRRKFGTFPVKKTFTFTEDFVKKIKTSGNMSLYIEEVLSKKFQLK